MLRVLASTVLLTAVVSCSKPAPVKTDPPAEPVATPTAPATGENAAPTRSSLDCAGVLAGTKNTVGAVYTAGSWGKLPAELRVLPAGAELCGAGSPTGKPDTYPGVLVRSALFGPPLGDFYTPILTKMGCTVEVEVVGSGDRKSTRGHFKCPQGKSGDFGTDTGYEFYYLSMLL